MDSQASLLVDVGNSFLKWTLWQADSDGFYLETQRVNHKQAGRTTATLLDEQWGTIENRITQIIVANVAGQTFEKEISDWCSTHWRIAPAFAQTSTSFKLANNKTVKNGYQNYTELGVDRWMAVIAAHELFPDNNVIIIDCGTATTVDVIGSNGQHRAGPIIPGINMMFQALSTNTADLIDMTMKQKSASVFADSTENAIVSGVFFAISKSVDAIIHEIRNTLMDEKCDDEVIVVFTGGAAASVIPQTQVKDYIIEPELILIGLKQMAVKKQ